MIEPTIASDVLMNPKLLRKYIHLIVLTPRYYMSCFNTNLTMNLCGFLELFHKLYILSES